MTYAEKQANRSKAFKEAIELTRGDTLPKDIVSQLEALQKDIRPDEEEDFLDLFEIAEVARG